MEKVQEMTTKYHIRTRLSKAPPVVSRYASFVEPLKKPQTIYEYIKDINLFCDFLKEQAHANQTAWNEESLKNLTSQDIQDFLFSYLAEYERTYERRNGKKVTQEFTNTLSGQRRKLSAIRSFCRYLFSEEKWLKDDISLAIELDKNPDKEKVYLNQMELDDYFQAIDRYTEDDYQLIRNRVMSQLFLYLGLKTSEVLALDIPDVNLETMTVRITRKDEEKEEISLPDSTKPDWNEYMEERKLRPIPIGWHEQALFVSLQNKRLNPKTIRYSMERYKRFTGIRKPLSPQVFRNTYAHISFKHIQELDAVSKRLGNRDKYATKRTYKEPKEL